MKYNPIIHIIPFLLLTSATYATVKTTRTDLVPKAEGIKTENIAIVNDSSIARTCGENLFNINAFSVKGFDKPVSELREIFFVTNNTTLHISRLQFKLRYTDINGNMLHERTELIDCDIPKGATRQLTIQSFDRQRSFYYYLSKKPKKQATPFKVALQLLRYDVIIVP